MSHKANVYSPPGTPLLDRTVGELVAERPNRSRIFQQFGIDFCCQGRRTLHEACARRGIAPETVQEQIEAELREKDSGALNPAELPPPALAAYIVETHHAFLRRELPRLHSMAERVAQVHGGHTPALREVLDVFVGLEDELQEHILKEENILFPAIDSQAQGRVTMPLDRPIMCMIHEHDDAGAALQRLRELTNGFVPPIDACNTYRALFAGLQELEEDLHTHIHLENAVLFPAVAA